MKEPQIKIDRFGWEYYQELPSGYRLGTPEDFHIRGKKKAGMKYLIQRADQPHLEIHYLREDTKSSRLKPFFDFGMIFVKAT